MSIVRIKLIATTIVNVDTSDAVDYEDLDDFLPEQDEDDNTPSTPADIAIAMVKSDLEEDSLPMDEFEWDVTDVEVVSNGTKEN